MPAHDPFKARRFAFKNINSNTRQYQYDPDVIGNVRPEIPFRVFTLFACGKLLVSNRGITA